MNNLESILKKEKPLRRNIKMKENNNSESTNKKNRKPKKKEKNWKEGMMKNGERMNHSMNKNEDLN